MGQQRRWPSWLTMQRKVDKTNGLVDLSSRARQQKLMALIDISEVWGVGGRIRKRLQAMGISTVLKLANSNTNLIRKNFNVVLERTVRELNGEPCIELEDIQHAVVMYEIRATEKLRGQGFRCRHISLFIATKRHGNEPQYANTASLISEYSTSNTRDIINFAMCGLDSIWRQGCRYAKAGIMLGDFYQSGMAQLDMFSGQLPHANADELMAALDQINKSGRRKFGLPVKCWWSHTERQQNLMSAKLTKLVCSCGSSGGILC